MVSKYFLENWALILILLAFSISLKITVFLDSKIIKRLYVLIVYVFLLSIMVHIEFFFAKQGSNNDLRIVLMAFRYSATPFIVAQVIYTLAKKFRAFVFVPAIIHAIINFASIKNGVVFSIDSDGTFHRGSLGLLPFIVAGIYCAFLVYILFKRSNKKAIEIIPIAFLCFSFISGLILPFVYGKDYSSLFSLNIAIALFVYYVFLILQLTKMDSLTGVLNRQAFYADKTNNPEDITAVLSLDMNGLKAINDIGGHAAGDEALITIALCFTCSLKRRQSVYRIGGDEFVIFCWKASKTDVTQLVQRIKDHVADTKYSCSIGYSYREGQEKSVDELIKESDEMMYADKALYYMNNNRDRRRR